MTVITTEDVGLHDFVCPAGTDWEKTIQVKISGSVVPLTDWTGVMTVRENWWSEGLPLLTVDVAIDEDDAVVTLSVDAADTVGMSYPDAEYNLVFTKGVAGPKQRVLQGKFKITPEITE